MPRKPQQKRAKATVDAIVQAGFISVARHGVGGTTTRHIAEIAGISVGSLYEYFANKEMIYDAMHQRFVADVVALLQPLLPELVRMSMADSVRAILHQFEAFLRKDNELYLKCARYAMQVDIKDYAEPVIRLLSELAVQHMMSHPDTRRVRRISTMTYIFINGGIYTVLRHLTDPNPPMSFDELAEGLAEMVGHYVAQELLLNA